MTIDSAHDSKISNRTINTNRISNRTYDSKSNRITKLRRSLKVAYISTNSTSKTLDVHIVHSVWPKLTQSHRDFHLNPAVTRPIYLRTFVTVCVFICIPSDSVALPPFPSELLHLYWPLCLHHLLTVAKSINYALRDVGRGLLIHCVSKNSPTLKRYSSKL